MTLDFEEIKYAKQMFGEQLWLMTVRNRIAKRGVEQIILEVSTETGFAPEVLRGKTRARPVAHARHKVMYLARCEGKQSLPDIGARLGGRDHSTVIHGANAHAERSGLDKPWEARR